MSDLHTHILGCKVNFADVQAVTELLEPGGKGPAALIGTCCVTAEGEKQSRKEVRRALRRVGSGGRVFVTGCAARLHPADFDELGENVKVVTGDPSEVAAAIRSELDGSQKGGPDPRHDASSRTRFFLKIQDGCANNCSYCVIPQVRGKPRSIPAGTVLATASEMVRAGYPELVVSGINAGAWRDRGRDLAWLMDRLAEIDGLVRLRLSSIEATAVTHELLETFKRHELIGRHLHLPLQSGDDGVLAAMGRRYDTAAFAAAVRLARQVLPAVNITTDAIVGFPVEDEAAFANTVAFVKAAGITKVHVFSYSQRPGTSAGKLGDPVPPLEKKRRGGVLRELSGSLQQAHRQRKLGVTSEILLESPLAGGVHGGYSSDYTRYVVDGGRPGALVRVLGEAVGPNGIEGKVAKA